MLSPTVGLGILSTLVLARNNDYNLIEINTVERCLFVALSLAYARA